MAGQMSFYKLITSNFRNLFITRPSIISNPQVATIRQISRERLKSIPEKPKKPLTPFFLFSQTRRGELKAAHPNAKITEIAKMLSEEWRNSDASLKEKYESAFKNAMTEYLKKNLEYNSKLTDAQKVAMKEISEEKARDKKNRQMRKTLKELKKPKRPKGPFIYFVLEYYAQNKSKYGKFSEFLRESKAIWEGLPPGEKQKFNDMYLDDKKRYDLEMEEWEVKMIKLGRTDLIRHNTLVMQTTPTRHIQSKDVKARGSSKSGDSKSGSISKETASKSSSKQKHTKSE